MDIQTDTLSSPNDSLVQSYLNLRKAVGLLGMLLPAVVVGGTWALQGPHILNSLSDYYYSIMGDVFVGSLCAIGVFLWSYRGYTARDSLAANIAAFSAVGVALFPKAPDVGATELQTQIAAIHFASAAAFFLTLAYFSLVLFRKTNPNLPPTPMKLVRNQVYLVSGFLIVLCVVGIVSVYLTHADAVLSRYHPVLWLESVAVFAFGVAWFVKGEAILQDTYPTK